MKSNGINIGEPNFRKALADEISDDPTFYNPKYIEFFINTSNTINISIHDYDFKQNAVAILEKAWDYEVKDYISKNELNIYKRWVINDFIKMNSQNDSGLTKNDDEREEALKYIDLAANNIIMRLLSKDGLI